MRSSSRQMRHDGRPHRPRCRLEPRRPRPRPRRARERNGLGGTHAGSSRSRRQRLGREARVRDVPTGSLFFLGQIVGPARAVGTGTRWGEYEVSPRSIELLVLVQRHPCRRPSAQSGDAAASRRPSRPVRTSQRPDPLRDPSLRVTAGATPISERPAGGDEQGQAAASVCASC